MDNKKAFLVILDGWGHGSIPETSAIDNAITPVMDALYQSYPNAELTTFGEEVGLPEGQMGNSEVGHLNIGAGRIVFQELARINNAIKEKELHRHPDLIQAMRKAKANNSAFHIMGLVSDGGVHSHITHLFAMIDIARAEGLEKIYVHAFTDGRDVAPDSGLGFLEALQEKLNDGPGELVNIIGRYFAMDRDTRWERTKIAYDCLIKGEGEASEDLLSVVKSRYAAGEMDEFLKPIQLVDNEKNPQGLIQENDTVVCINFRTDRPRQISTVLTQKDFPENGMKKLALDYLTMTSYDSTYQDVTVLFEKDNLTNTLGETISNAGKTQVRIAETEKYPHVTFFFNGGREAEFKGEKRIMIPSPKVATYDLQPEMSAAELTDAIINEMNANTPDFICLNFANPDMVGHTGILEAAVKAVETVDECLGKILDIGKKLGYDFIVIADHGNADIMINPDGSPHTAHTTNPVPVLYVGEQFKKLANGKLADIAPSILRILDLEPPEEMNGINLLEA